MNETVNYNAWFLRSRDHLWLAVLTLGIGLFSASLLGMLLGIGGYALGWIYLPGLPFFRRKVDAQLSSEQQAQEEIQLAEFNVKRNVMIRSLSPERQAKYSQLSQVCVNIERSSCAGRAEGEFDPVLRKLDELMWTYLRLLSMEQSLHAFLESERQENLGESIKLCETDVNKTKAEVDTLSQQCQSDPSSVSPNLVNTKQRLLDSKSERLSVLKKRLERVSQAKINIDIVIAEQERLSEQIKLLRSDAIATKNSEALSSRIDASVQTLGQTHALLSELDDFKDLAGDIPATNKRLGVGNVNSGSEVVIQYNIKMPPSRKVTRVEQ
jgi:hypothetical protein